MLKSPDQLAYPIFDCFARSFCRKGKLCLEKHQNKKEQTALPITKLFDNTCCHVFMHNILAMWWKVGSDFIS